MATVKLFHRHHGVHEYLKEIKIEGNMCRYARRKNKEKDYIINEGRLLSAIPDGFLPTNTKGILLMIGDKNGSTGQCGLKLFRNWAKYFDCYSIELSN